GDARTTYMINVGAKAVRLHGDRPIGQPDRRDVSVRPDARTAGKPPRQSTIGQFELMGGAHQRRLEGVMGRRGVVGEIGGHWRDGEWSGFDVRYPTSHAPVKRRSNPKLH